jgi:UDP-N-acetylglucosamine acyltransferase
MGVVHATAIAPQDLPDDVSLGPFAVVELGALIGHGCRLEAHALVASCASIGDRTRVFPGAVVGLDPQIRPLPDDSGGVRIGSDTVLREHVTVNAGSTPGSFTRVGDRCLLMAGAHVGHDCSVGDDVTLVNGVALGGFVEVEHNATISAMVPVHQYVRIGAYSYVGGGFRVVQDVPPFVLAAGEPLKPCGINVTGLRRCGFGDERIAALKRLYRLFYRSGLNVSEALARFDELEPSADRDRFSAFVVASSRGVIR